MPRSGADDEDTRRDIEGDGQEDQLAVGGRDHWGNASNDAPFVRTLARSWLRLCDRRRGKPSQKRVPLATCEQVSDLYQTRYCDFNVKHFHEKRSEEHGIQLAYTRVKRALQGAGLVAREKKRTAHRKRRPRKMPGIMLHLDGSKHVWFQDDRYYGLIVVLDDATSETYYAQLVEEESPRWLPCAKVTASVGFRGGKRGIDSLSREL